MIINNNYMNNNDADYNNEFQCDNSIGRLI